MTKVLRHSTEIDFPGAGGLRLVADSYGPSAGPPVLLLHGGGQTRYAWGNTGERLAARGYHALALDLRGHGQSGWASDGDYSVEAFVEDLRHVSEQLGAAPALVGASLGGACAAIAVGEGMPAAALVLVDIVPRMLTDGVNRIRQFMEASPEGFESLEAAADAVAQFLPHRPRPASPEGLRKNLRLAENGRWYWHWDPNFRRGIRDNRRLHMFGRMEIACQQIHIPTLIVRGKQSEVVSTEAVAHLRELMPEAEAVDVEKASHMVAGDRNDAFNTSIEDFLTRRYPPAADARRH